MSEDVFRIFHEKFKSIFVLCTFIMVSVVNHKSQQAQLQDNLKKIYSTTCFERPLNFSTNTAHKRQVALQKRDKINIKSKELHK